MEFFRNEGGRWGCGWGVAAGKARSSAVEKLEKTAGRKIS